MDRTPTELFRSTDTVCQGPYSCTCFTSLCCSIDSYMAAYRNTGSEIVSLQNYNLTWPNTGSLHTGSYQLKIINTMHWCDYHIIALCDLNV